MGLQLTSWLCQFIPGQCLACHCWPAQPLCQACFARFQRTKHRCIGCGLELADSAASQRCGACLPIPHLIDACCIGVDYSYPWSLLIKHWKYNSNPALCKHMASWLRMQPHWAAILADIDFTIPIPNSNARICERGFDHTLLLAQALDCPRIRTDILLRSPSVTTSPHARKTRKARLQSIRNAFHIASAHQFEIAGKTILLIDDVITTAATMRAAADCLKAAGATSVVCAALARTPANTH